MSFFDVNRPLAYLIACNIGAWGVGAFVTVRTVFHARYLDIVDDFMKEVRNEQLKTRGIAAKALGTAETLMRIAKNRSQ